jgi:type VII secretion integral membrane protein EccD
VSPETVAVSRCVAGSPGLVRVTVTSSTRRVDLVLPGAVPVADLVPELARGVGLLDAKTVHGGYRLVTPDGRALAADSGLTVQGVEDGAVITVAAGVDDEPPRVYDDVVEAMTDVVERDLRPWDGAAGRRTTLGAATAVLALGAAALLSQRGSDVATAITMVVAVGLVVAAVAVSRSPSRGAAAVTMALVGCGYAAVAGLMTGGGAPLSGTPIAAAGGGAVVTGFVAALGLGRSRALLLPAVVAGGVLVAAGLAVRSRSGDAAVVLTSVLALVVLAGSLFPWLALGVTGTGVDPPFPAGGPSDGPSGDPSGGAVRIDPQRVAADARVAHEILVGLSATVGVLLVLASAPAVSLGPAGTVVSLLACTTVTLRARQYHAHAEVLVGLVSGVLGLLATSASVLWLHPSWRPVAAVALEVTGAVLLTLALRPRAAAVRRGLGDLAEGAALLALLPALVIASGVVTTLRG